MIQVKGEDGKFREASSIRIAKKSIAKVYIGAKLIWSKISEFWRDDDVWRDDEEW